MKTIKTSTMPNSSILRINSERERFNLSPRYQRSSGIWTTEKKQLFIDSILNEYDIPKMYFHDLTRRPSERKDAIKYSVIDGRQRLETIWGFIDGHFPLDSTFKFFEDTDIAAGGLTYSDLSKKYPELKIRFDGFNLPIVLVETNDEDLIEDMFTRLNEAVALNAAEKRNALGGPMAKLIRELTDHNFFKHKVKFNNLRYRHFEVVARLLFIEDCMHRIGKLIDTKKPYLDKMVKDYKSDKKLSVPDIEHRTRIVLDIMSKLFVNQDTLLTAQSAVPIYYLLIRDAEESKKLAGLKRKDLLSFRNKVRENRELAEKDLTSADFDLLEYDRMTVQGTNDASSIKERLRIISEYLGIREAPGATGSKHRY